ncbi:type IX secretion system membrane protein PorP/SprF [Aquirufa sp. LEPPI-3A]|uniref:type IX secretion system membrane protein PorP/SprF n=1 Tax=Aquirufa regiilacus TaxID=3024868 RepID=UPI0028DF834F|nr:type IX secretion system membrane protein PorP/SprF [Aquirufa sp. LEPPI-3A]MDT8886926.1 type IX secretion system membrane protein PorP/SprF [Aquirufa sp. LEPPI-3A]
MRKVVVFLLMSLPLLAQQESLRMVYPFMPLAINPAIAGAKGVGSITGIYRKKPLFQGGITNTASSQQYFSFDMPIALEKGGIGFLAYNTDQSYALASGGIAANLGLAAVAAKNFAWGRGNYFRIGVQVGVNQYPIIGKSGTSVLGGHYGWGVHYTRGDLQVGFSSPANSFESSYGSLHKPMYLSGQYILHLNQHAVKLGAILRNQQETMKSDYYAVFWFKEKVGAGIWYQGTGSELGSKALLGSLEVALGKNFRAGYAYDFLGESTAYFPAGFGSTVSSERAGFHQLFIRYEVDLGNGKIAEFRP